MRTLQWLGLLAMTACDRSASTAFDLSPRPPDLAMPPTLNGTVDGQPFPVAAAIFYSFGPSVIQLSTDAMACSDEVNEVLRRGARDLFIQTNAPFSTTTYAVTMSTPMAGQAIAYWRAVDANCGLSNGNAVSGTINISAAGANVVIGNLDLTFDVGNEHVSGGFSASACAQNGSNPPVTCP
jgi:hypothetical protein